MLRSSRVAGQLLRRGISMSMAIANVTHASWGINSAPATRSARSGSRRPPGAPQRDDVTSVRSKRTALTSMWRGCRCRRGEPRASLRRYDRRCPARLRPLEPLGRPYPTHADGAALRLAASRTVLSLAAHRQAGRCWARGRRPHGSDRRVARRAVQVSGEGREWVRAGSRGRLVWVVAWTCRLQAARLVPVGQGSTRHIVDRAVDRGDARGVATRTLVSRTTATTRSRRRPPLSRCPGECPGAAVRRAPEPGS
jgi:hypothetical protein